MAKTIFPYVEDEIFLKEVSAVFQKMDASREKIDNDFYDNVVDPFSALFDSAGRDIIFEEWKQEEEGRQLQKTLQNEIGYFHQRILGSIGDWIDPGLNAGYDSENKKHKIFAEIKNKWNTFNSNSEAETYDKMSGLLDGDKKGYTGYVVFIIPKTPVRFKKKFIPSKRSERENLFLVDGATYYELVTGDKDALIKLFHALPIAIHKLRKVKPDTKKFIDLFYKAYGK